MERKNTGDVLHRQEEDVRRILEAFGGNNDRDIVRASEHLPASTYDTTEATTFDLSLTFSSYHYPLYCLILVSFVAIPPVHTRSEKDRLTCW